MNLFLFIFMYLFLETLPSGDPPQTPKEEKPANTERTVTLRADVLENLLADLGAGLRNIGQLFSGGNSNAGIERTKEEKPAGSGTAADTGSGSDDRTEQRPKRRHILD